MRIVFVRHGQTPANVAGSLDTDAPGPDLTDLGRRQAAAIPTKLAGYPIDHVVVSNLVRTHQTARPFIEQTGVSVSEEEGLREIRAGVWEKETDIGSLRGFLDTVLAWVDGDDSAAIPGGESGAEFFARVDGVIAKQRHDTVALFSHGALIRAWVASRVATLDADFIRKRPLANTGIVVVNGSFDGGWMIERWESERF